MGRLQRYTIWVFMATLLSFGCVTLVALSNARPRRASVAAPAAAPPATSSPAQHTRIVAELRAAHERWRQRGPAHYRFRYSRQCFCEALGTPEIEVRDRAVVAVVDLETGARPAVTPNYPTVEELFAYLETALSRNPDIADITFDPALGFPLRGALDWLNASDDEFGWEITAFEPLP